MRYLAERPGRAKRTLRRRHLRDEPCKRPVLWRSPRNQFMRTYARNAEKSKYGRGEESEMASKCKGYAGKIKNQGTQFVQAPFGGSDSRKGNVKITGTDLRTGKKSGK